MTKQFALIATTLCFAISPDFADDLPSRHGSRRSGGKLSVGQDRNECAGR